MKSITRFFLSLNTLVGIFIAFMVLLFAGSLSLVKNLAFFSGIDETPLFRWLSSAGNPSVTWWIYAMITLLALLAVSTLFCVAETLLNKMSRSNLMSRLSPQIMHMGVLFIMLGHLLTASWGFKTDLLIKKGEETSIAQGTALFIEDIKIETDENGYQHDWEARLWWIRNGTKVEQRVIRPVHPLYFDQFGLYIKAATADPEPSVQIRVCKDPGAMWALIGGVLLSAGGLAFIYSRLWKTA